MARADIHVFGPAPLLLPQTAGRQVEAPRGLKTKPLGGEEEAEQGAYRNADGVLCLPAVAFARALFQAASKRKIGKLTARVALAGTVIEGELLPLVVPDSGELIKEFTVDTRFVRIDSARIPRSRSRIESWAVNVPIEWDEDLIDERAIRELLFLAGKMIGVGDYRPATGGGSFGRFSI